MKVENSFRAGDRWAICDVCADKIRHSRLIRDSRRKLWVCPECRDVPNPQEYIRPPKPIKAQGPSRPATYYYDDTILACHQTSVPGDAIPGCLTPSIME